MSLRGKMFQYHLFSIKHRVGEIINPVSHNGGYGVVAGLVLHGLVLVAEDEEVDGGVELCLLLGVLVKAGVGDIVVVASFHFVVELLQAMPV